MPPPVSPAGPPDFFHVERDEEYLLLLHEEERYWDERIDTVLTKKPPSWVQEHQNERLTGDHSRRWFEEIPKYGPFVRGCVLGAGPGEVEAHLLRANSELRLTVYDISREALERQHTRVDAEFPGRMEVRQEDLNFVTLPTEAFDLIVSESCLHHLVNLEHLAYQVNQSLTSEGYFFLHDTVGESYFQFSEEKKRLFEALVRTTRDDEPFFDWPDRDNWTYSPFEAARSGETLEVLERYLSQVSLRTVNSLMEMTLFVRDTPLSYSRALHWRALRFLSRNVKRLRTRLPSTPTITPQQFAGGMLMLMLDGICSDSGYLKPGVAFATYRKRLAAGPPASQ